MSKSERSCIVMKLKKIAIAVSSVVVFILLFACVQRLVMPKYMDDILEGNFTEEYYKETTEHDVIFVGDCEVYENFSHAEPQKEEYNRMTIDGMKWSETKINAIKASMLEEENMFDYVFPILRYHSRITELNKNDIKYFFSKRKIAHNGYYMRVDTTLDNMAEDTDVENSETGQDSSIEKDADDFMSFEDFEIVADYGDDTDNSSAEDEKYKFGEYPMEYLDKMRELCNEKGITLILVKAPRFLRRIRQ